MTRRPVAGCCVSRCRNGTELAVGRGEEPKVLGPILWTYVELYDGLTGDFIRKITASGNTLDDYECPVFKAVFIAGITVFTAVIFAHAGYSNSAIPGIIDIMATYLNRPIASWMGGGAIELVLGLMVLMPAVRIWAALGCGSLPLAYAWSCGARPVWGAVTCVAAAVDQPLKPGSALSWWCATLWWRCLCCHWLWRPCRRPGRWPRWVWHGGWCCCCLCGHGPDYCQSPAHGGVDLMSWLVVSISCCGWR